MSSVPSSSGMGSGLMRAMLSRVRSILLAAIGALPLLLGESCRADHRDLLYGTSVQVGCNFRRVRLRIDGSDRPRPFVLGRNARLSFDIELDNGMRLRSDESSFDVTPFRWSSSIGEIVESAPDFIFRPPERLLPETSAQVHLRLHCADRHIGDLRVPIDLAAREGPAPEAVTSIEVHATGGLTEDRGTWLMPGEDIRLRVVATTAEGVEYSTTPGSSRALPWSRLSLELSNLRVVDPHGHLQAEPDPSGVTDGAAGYAVRVRYVGRPEVTSERHFLADLSRLVAPTPARLRRLTLTPPPRGVGASGFPLIAELEDDLGRRFFTHPEGHARRISPEWVEVGGAGVRWDPSRARVSSIPYTSTEIQQGIPDLSAARHVTVTVPNSQLRAELCLCHDTIEWFSRYLGAGERITIADSQAVEVVVGTLFAPGRETPWFLIRVVAQSHGGSETTRWTIDDQSVNRTWLEVPAPATRTDLPDVRFRSQAFPLNAPSLSGLTGYPGYSTPVLVDSEAARFRALISIVAPGGQGGPGVPGRRCFVTERSEYCGPGCRIRLEPLVACHDTPAEAGAQGRPGLADIRISPVLSQRAISSSLPLVLRRFASFTPIEGCAPNCGGSAPVTVNSP